MIRFTNPVVESLSRAVCEAHGGDNNLKMVGGVLLLNNAEDDYQKYLLETADQLEQKAKAIRAAHAFNEMAKTLKTDVEEEED